MPARKFAGRADCFEVVDQALAGLGDGYRVVNFFGVSGVGKSRLCKEIGGFFDRKDAQPPAWGLVDFEETTLRESPSATLFHMRQNLQRRYGFGFPSFDIAYAVYWQRLHGQTEFARPELPLLDEGDLLAEIVDMVEEVPGIGLITKLPKLVHKASRRVQDWWIQRGQRSLARLPELEGFEIERRLPVYWALDLKTQTKDRPVVLILDTYEALWTNHPSAGGWTRVDEWVRNWILELPEVLWIVAGREPIVWHEHDPNWTPAIEHCVLEALPGAEAGAFLQSCGIVEPRIVDAILGAAQGNPFYLNLAADTYESICQIGSPRPDDFGRTPFELVERFTRYLSDSQLGTLEVLAVPNGWDTELFARLVQKFDTGFPTQHHPRLTRHFFVQKEAGTRRWHIHALMRKALLEHPRFADPAQVHTFLFEYYKAQLEGVSRAAGGPEHVESLREALYHGQHVVTVGELSSWLLASVDAFDHWRHGRSLLPLYEQVLHLARDSGLEESALAADLHLRRGYSLSGCDRHAEAEKAYRATLRIRQLCLAPNDPAVASAHLELGRLLRNLDRLEEAKEHAHEAERGYAVDQAVQAGEAGIPSDRFANEGLSDSLQLLGSLCAAEYQFPEARDLFERALSLSPSERETDRANLQLDLAGTLAHLERESERAHTLVREAVATLERHYGPRSIRSASAKGHLALVLSEEGRYAEAEALIMDCLEIARECLGEESSGTANMLAILATIRSSAGLDDVETHTLNQSALATTSAIFGEQHSATALLSLRLANRSAHPEDVRARTIPMLLRAWHTLRALHGISHPQSLQAQTDVAEAYRMVGDLEEADRMLSEAAGLCSDRGPQFWLTEGVVWEIWGAVKRDLTQGNHAEANLLRAVRIYESHLPRSRIRLATSLQRLGELYLSDARVVEADQILRRARLLHEEIYGPDHLRVVDSLTTTATLQRAMNASHSALETVEKALSILRNSGRAEELPALLAQLTKGRLLGDVGKHEVGIALVRRTIREIEARYPHLESRVLQAQRCLGTLLSDAGDTSKARAVLSVVLDRATVEVESNPAQGFRAAYVYEDLLKLGAKEGTDMQALLRRGEALATQVEEVAPSAAAYIHLSMGEYLFNHERLAEAKAALRTACDLGQPATDMDLRIRAPLKLAWCLGRMGEFEELEPLLLKTLDAAREAYGPYSPSEVKACHLLAEYHEHVGNPVEALRYAGLFLEASEAALSPDDPLLAKALTLEASMRTAAEGYSSPLEAQLRRASSLYASIPTADPLDHAEALIRLGQQVAGHQRSEEGAALLQQALDLLDGRSNAQLHRALALAALGSVYAMDPASESFRKAEPLLREAESSGRAAGGTILSDSIAEAVQGLIIVLHHEKRYAELDAYLANVLAELEDSSRTINRLYQDSSRTINRLYQEALVAHCFVRAEQGHLDAAVETLEKLLQLDAYPGEEAGSMLLNIALKVIAPLKAAGQTKQVRTIYGQLMKAVELTAGLPADHHQLLLVLHARAATANEELEEGENLLKEYLVRLEQTGSRPMEAGIQAMEEVAARLHTHAERLRAARWFELAWKLRNELYPTFQYSTALAAMNFGVALALLNEWERARPVLMEALEGHHALTQQPQALTAAEQRLVDGRVGEILYNLGLVEYHSGAYAASLERLQDSLLILRESQGEDDPRCNAVEAWLTHIRHATAS